MSVELLINAIIAGLLLGGFYAAVTVGVRCLPMADRRGRLLATAAIVLGAVEILFTAAWTVAG